MMVSVELKFNHGFKWFEKNGIYVKGYVFDKNNNLYRNNGLTDYFRGCESEAEFRHKVEQANGIFSVVILTDNIVYAAVDRIRTFPLFYTETQSGIIISDDTYYIRDTLNLDNIDRLSEKEFLHTGYVTGENTLLENVFQVQAGQYITAGKKLKKEYYFKYVVNTVFIRTYEELEKGLLEILEDIFVRLLKSVDNRTIVIPLSGGYDSRLIAIMLKRLGYENVVCFTYGRRDNVEVGISKEVAGKLGYRFIYVEYSDGFFDGFAEEELFVEYEKFAANHTSVIMLQDYFAVKYMQDNNLIPADSVFVPGHSGDFIAGDHIPGCFKDKSKKYDVLKEILKIHYSLEKTGKTSKSPELRAKISGLLNEGYSHSSFEDWDTRERQAKFIVNADRVYEMFGYEHRIPLWDHALVDFFKYLDLEYKPNKWFYDSVLEKKIFSDYNFEFEEIRKGITFLQGIKMRIKKYLPKIIFDTYKSKRDVYCFYPVSKQLHEKMVCGDGIDVWNDNYVVACWYLESLKNAKKTGPL
ncbi:7-cyano-7-deazaguanine synthase [Candidatus Latescibacterota bacterium]